MKCKSIVILSNKKFVKVIEVNNKKITKINVSNNSPIAAGAIVLGTIKNINQKFFFVESLNTKQQIFGSNTFHEQLSVGQTIFTQIEKENLNKKKHKAATILQIKGQYCAVLTNKTVGLDEVKALPSYSKMPKSYANWEEINNFLPKFLVVKLLDPKAEKELVLDEAVKIINVMCSALKNKCPHFGEIENQLLLNPKLQIYVQDEQLIERIQNFAKIIGHQPNVHKKIDYPALFQKENYDIFKNSISIEGGGSFVVNKTEGMTSIDVNSDASYDFTDINLRAASAIRNYLTMRNVMGIIVVDFISFHKSQKDRQNEAAAIAKTLSEDKSIVSIKFIKHVYLAVIIRKAKGLCIDDYLFDRCPNCSGRGLVPATEVLYEWAKIIVAAKSNSPIYFNSYDELATFLKLNPKLVAFKPKLFLD